MLPPMAGQANGRRSGPRPSAASTDASRVRGSVPAVLVGLALATIPWLLVCIDWFDALARPGGPLYDQGDPFATRGMAVVLLEGAALVAGPVAAGVLLGARGVLGAFLGMCLSVAVALDAYPAVYEMRHGTTMPDDGEVLWFVGGLSMPVLASVVAAVSAASAWTASWLRRRRAAREVMFAVDTGEPRHQPLGAISGWDPAAGTGETPSRPTSRTSATTAVVVVVGVVALAMVPGSQAWLEAISVLILAGAAALWVVLAVAGALRRRSGRR